jgi:hypothetical protein
MHRTLWSYFWLIQGSRGGGELTTPGENIPGAPEMAPWKKSSLTTRRTERRVVVWKVKKWLMISEN